VEMTSFMAKITEEAQFHLVRICGAALAEHKGREMSHDMQQDSHNALL
jgi:hypothetical protein